MINKVLIIDDIEVNAELIKEILIQSELELEILFANNGLEGIELAKKEDPDIILMDWKMPELNGIEAIKELKKHHSTKDIPILMVTAYSSPENIKNAFKAGVFDYIAKPVNQEELTVRIEKALHISFLTKEAKNRINTYKKKLEDLTHSEFVTKNSKDGYLILDSEGNIEWANESFTKLHGYEFDQYIKIYGKSIIDHDELSDLEYPFKKCQKTKTDTTFLHKYIDHSDSLYWLQITFVPKVSFDGEIEKVLVMESDITLLKDQAAEMNKENQRFNTFAEYLEDATNQLEIQKKEINMQKLQIEVEQKKSEELLLNILPFEVARQLKSKGRAKPRYYKEVSVMFADFKGFSKFSKELEPRELIQVLDNFFAKFDEIAEKNYLEKIKTMGDAFMAAGGLPLRNNSHSINAVLAGLEIQHFMNSLNDEKVLRGESVWELRLGIHTGPVVAGVVGRKKFAYDIWGDTVNIASRMEQNGAVGMINISSTTYELIKDYFDCTHRGKIEAKNIGEIDMYFVDRIKKDLSADEIGLLPNKKFDAILGKL